MLMNAATKREFKDQLFEQFARIGKSLSNGRRLEILELLAQGPRTVEDLARETGLSVANASQHLQVLRRCHLVSVKREGLFANYKLASDDVLRMCISIRRLGERHLSDIQRLVETYLSSREKLEPISCQELLRRLKEESIFLLDVRPREEYEAGHIAGARSIPLSELKTRLKEIPRKREIVAYCRGPYCVFADEAVSILASRGYRAVRLREGFPEWKTRRFSIEAGLDSQLSCGEE
jgi:rhodanese-related sulfurtransferase/DNA-binding transcriptional ArsR family regulator